MAFGIDNAAFRNFSVPAWSVDAAPTTPNVSPSRRIVKLNCFILMVSIRRSYKATEIPAPAVPDQNFCVFRIHVFDPSFPSIFGRFPEESSTQAKARTVSWTVAAAPPP